MRRQINTGIRIGQDPAADNNMPAVWPLRPGDDVEDGRFPGPGWSEKGGETRTAFECDIEHEIISPLTRPEVDGRRHTRHSNTAICRWIRRFRISETTRAAIAITIETQVNLRAWASPPGTCMYE